MTCVPDAVRAPVIGHSQLAHSNGALNEADVSLHAARAGCDGVAVVAADPGVGGHAFLVERPADGRSARTNVANVYERRAYARNRRERAQDGNARARARLC